MAAHEASSTGSSQARACAPSRADARGRSSGDGNLTQTPAPRALEPRRVGMDRRIVAVCMGGALAVSVACGSSQSSSTAKPASTAPATTTTATVAKGDFGVPECDDYMTKYLACIDSKVPEAARATVRQSVEQTKSAWQQAASTPQGREGLATVCKQATESAK